MTINQMKQSLASVGAEFFMSSAKCTLDTDPLGAKPSYHIKPATPGGEYGNETLVRVFSQGQFLDWVATTKAAARATDDEAREMIWENYHRRSYGRAAKERDGR